MCRLSFLLHSYRTHWHMRPSKLLSSASIAQQVQVSLNFTSALYITVHTAVMAQLPVPWLLLCVRLLVLCDWSPEIPGRLKSHKRVRGFRMYLAAILRRVRQKRWRQRTEAWDITEVSTDFVRMPPALGVAVTRTWKICFGWSWTVMYFSEGQVLTCQLHFQTAMLLPLVVNHFHVPGCIQQWHWNIIW